MTNRLPARTSFSHWDLPSFGLDPDVPVFVSGPHQQVQHVGGRRHLLNLRREDLLAKRRRKLQGSMVALPTTEKARRKYRGGGLQVRVGQGHDDVDDVTSTSAADLRCSKVDDQQL